MTFEEFLEEKNLTPENTPGSEHVLLQEAYREGFLEGRMTEKTFQSWKKKLQNLNIRLKK